jgi:D-tyrosyl-tRNA(Tyr) deacylase
MRAIVQRSLEASCVVDGNVTGSIDKGFMILVGFTHTDTLDEIKLLTRKIAGLRVFEDECGKLNKSIKDVNGSILAISQFTLYADCKRGNRPSFTDAMYYEKANDMFNIFVEELRQYDIKVETGVFGADMKIKFTNDGPVTIILDNETLK